jgi:transposase
MSLNSWLVAGIVPAVERQPMKKMSVDGQALLFREFAQLYCATD